MRHRRGTAHHRGDAEEGAALLRGQGVVLLLQGDCGASQARRVGFPLDTSLYRVLHGFHRRDRHSTTVQNRHWLWIARRRRFDARRVNQTTGMRRKDAGETACAIQGQKDRKDQEVEGLEAFRLAIWLRENENRVLAAASLREEGARVHGLI